MTIDSRTVYDADGIAVDVELENCFSDMPPETTSIRVVVRWDGATVARVKGSLAAASLLDLWDTRYLWGYVGEAVSRAAEGAGFPLPGPMSTAIAWVLGKIR